MKIFRFSDLVLAFLKIIDHSHVNLRFLSFFNGLALILFFTQPLSYVHTINGTLSNEKFGFFSYLIHYSNFSNIFSYFQSRPLTFVFYIILVFSLNLFLAFWFFLSFSLRNLKAITPMLLRVTPIFRWAFLFFFWFFLIPSLELLINPLFCLDSNGYVSCEDVFSWTFIVVSGYMVGVILLLSVLFLTFGKSYRFLDGGNINPSSKISGQLSFYLRMSLPFSFSVFHTNFQILVYSIIFFELALCWFEYRGGPIMRFRSMSGLYIIVLSLAIVFIMIMLIMDSFLYVTSYSFFYHIVILWQLATKFGINFSRQRYMGLISNAGKFAEESILEEVMNLCSRHFDDKHSEFYLYGLLRNHLKKCNNPKCRMNSQSLNNFKNLSFPKKEKKIQLFIIQLFTHLISSKELTHSETLSLKYLSFLLSSNMSPYKTFLEFHRIKRLMGKTSIFQDVILRFEKKKIVERIQELERLRHFRNAKEMALSMESDDKLEIITFFVLNEKCGKMQESSIELLQAKVQLIERYKEGFSSYDEILSSLSILLQKAKRFEAQIEGFPRYDNNFLLHKYSSFYSCLIFNDLQTANKHEDEISNIRNKYSKAMSTEITPLIFLNKNVVVCQISFLSKQGNIIESSKTEKLARFFNYPATEIRSLKTIPDMMPECLGKYHASFVEWRLRRDWTEESNSKGFSMEGFAAEKTGFVFPVRVLSGLNPCLDDFVMNSAIVKLNGYGEGVLFESSGSIIGFSEGFFRFLWEKNKKVTFEGLSAMNLFFLMEGLRLKLDKNYEENKQKDLMLSNQSATLLMPENIHEIMDLMVLKKKDGLAEKTSPEMMQSSKTATAISKTQPSTNICFAFVSKFLSKITSSSQLRAKKDLLMRLCEEPCPNEPFYNQLFENCKITKIHCNFDLKFKSYFFGKHSEEVVRTIWLKINTFSEINEANISGESASSQSLLWTPLQMPPPNVAEIDVVFERELLPSNIKNASSRRVSQDAGVLPFSSRRSGMQEQKVIEPDWEESKILDKNKGSKEEKNSFEINKTRIFEMKKTSSMADNFDEKFQGKDSAKGSSLGFSKENFGIFKELADIKTNKPINIMALTLFLMFQGILMLSYCLFTYFVTSSYITDTYLPLQEANLNQCRVNVLLNDFVLLAQEYEFIIRNMTTLDDFYIEIFQDMMNETYVSVRDLHYHDREFKYNFDFGDYTGTMTLLTADNGKLTQILYSDLTERYLDIYYDLITVEPKSSLKEDLKFVPRNFLYWVTQSRNLRDKISAEFLAADGIVTNKLVIFLWFNCITIGFLKIIEWINFRGFQRKISQILTIFLRMNQNDIEKELLFHKKLISEFKDTDKSYLNENFPDKIMNKSNIRIQEEPPLSISKAKTKLQVAKGKKIKKTSVFYIQPFSQVQIFVYLAIVFSIPFSFYIGTYYYWIKTNQSFSTMMNVNAVIFNKLYTHAKSSMAYTYMLLREKLIREPEYEKINEFYLNHTNRMNYFYSNARNRILSVQTYGMELPKYGISTSDFIKSSFLDEIMKGNTCEALYLKGYLKSQKRRAHCETLLDNAFQKGILTVTNQYLNVLKAQTLIINMKEDNATLQGLKDILRQNDHADFLIANYYMCQVIFWFYEVLMNYYLIIVQNQIETMKSVVWILCVFGLLVLFALGLTANKIMRRMYELAWKSLALLPFEKLTNDEQTIFLLKKYRKENIKE